MKKFFIFLYLLAALVYPAEILAEDLTPVKSEGIAARSSEEKTDVKNRALDMAFKKAVAAALDLLLKSESLSANPGLSEQAVYSNPRAYIVNYKILAEGWVNHMEPVQPLPDPSSETAAASGGAGVELYHIWIEASVDSAQLRGALSRIISNGDSPISSTTLNILDMPDYNSYKTLLASLKRIPIIKDITYSSFYRGRIVLTARATAGTQSLLERIAKEVSDSFIVIAGGPQTIIIKPAPKPVASR